MATIFTMLLLGLIKGYISRPRGNDKSSACAHVLKSGFVMMLMGMVSAAVSWGLGLAMAQVLAAEGSVNGTAAAGLS